MGATPIILVGRQRLSGTHPRLLESQADLANVL
jgi:hypothetical protein